MTKLGRRGPVLLGALLLGSAFAVTPSVSAPSVSAVSWGTCRSIYDGEVHPQYYAFAQYMFPNTLSGGSHVYGVRAAFDPATNFKRCSGPGIDTEGLGSSSAWVAMVNTASNDDIFQIGINDCNDVTNPSVCPPHSPGTLRYFYAYGWRCGSSVQRPIGHDLGAADTGSHTYTVTITSGTPKLVNMYIDGVLKFSVPLGYKCWVNDPASDPNVRFLISGEVHDQGDGLGSSTARSKFLNVDRRVAAGGSWGNASIPSCQTAQTTGAQHTFCAVPASDRLDIWTQ